MIKVVEVVKALISIMHDSDCNFYSDSDSECNSD